jgi:hypothetical protein
VRTTLTLDADVAARLKAEARRSGRPFKQVVNDCLRAGLATRHALKEAPPFRLVVRDLGGPVAGRNYDDIGALLEEIEGAWRR